MAITSCTGIQAEADRLISLFEPCYTLTATDVDDITSLIQSV